MWTVIRFLSPARCLVLKVLKRPLMSVDFSSTVLMFGCFNNCLASFSFLALLLGLPFDSDLIIAMLPIMS